MSVPPREDEVQPHLPPSDDRLDSWKEIAGYLKRDVTTMRRWEKREGMPVHRHVHDKAGSVYAFKSELDAWAKSRKAIEDPQRTPAPTPAAAAEADVRSPPRWLRPLQLAGAGAIVVALWAAWTLASRDRSGDDVLAGARFVRLTDFGGNEQAAALSPDGQYVALLSDRSGRTDVWVGRVGTGQFYNLTQGAAFELVNPSLRNLGFSPDGGLVTFWARHASPASKFEINVWAVPVLGGAPTPYLEDIAEFDWSPDGRRLVYHTPGPGDPTFVRDGAGSAPRQIFVAAAGLHAHFPIWSPDQRFIYFVQGEPPDRMDIWRVAVDGGEPERITHHEGRVSHPVFDSDRTLLYLATDSDGGPWLHALDVDRRRPQRLGSGVERYSSLSASGNRRRLVATVSNPRSSLWRLPLAETATLAAGTRMMLTTASGTTPRHGPGYLLFLAATGDRHGIWRVEQDRSAELWSAPGARLIGAPAVSRSGELIAFVAERDRITTLYTAKADGTDARVLTSSLKIQGGPAWSPGDRALTVSAMVDGVPKLLNVPLDGGPSEILVNDHALDPVWSPDGRLLVYSGPDVGTTFQLKAVTSTGPPFAPLTLSRGSRRACFTPDSQSLLVLRGGIGGKQLWSIDLATGSERQLSQFQAGTNVQDFDISRDGREVIVEERREHSDIVLIERSVR